MNCEAFFTALSDTFLPAQNNISPEEFASGRLKNSTNFKILSSVFLKNVPQFASIQDPANGSFDSKRIFLLSVYKQRLIKSF